MGYDLSLQNNGDEFLTGNGSNLKAELVEDICNMRRIDHKLSVAYSHEENTIVERSNLEVIRYLRALVFDSNSTERWSMFYRSRSEFAMQK